MFSQRNVLLQEKKNQRFVAPERGKMISLQDIPCVVIVTVRDTKFCAPGLSQIVRFSGYRPLTNREKKMRKVTQLLSPLPQGAPNRLKWQIHCVYGWHSSVTVFYVELCLFIACVFVRCSANIVLGPY